MSSNICSLNLTMEFRRTICRNAMTFYYSSSSMEHDVGFARGSQSSNNFTGRLCIAHSDAAFDIG